MNRPPQPEPPPRRRRSVRGERPWRTRGPAGDVTTTRLAERVMTARGESVCPRCRTLVTAGQQIGLVDGEWLHVACLLGRVPMIGPHSGALRCRAAGA